MHYPGVLRLGWGAGAWRILWGEGGPKLKTLKSLKKGSQKPPKKLDVRFKTLSKRSQNALKSAQKALKTLSKALRKSYYKTSGDLIFIPPR